MTFEKIIQVTAKKLQDGQTLAPAEVSLLAGYAAGAAEAMPIMRETIRTQDAEIDNLRQIVSRLRPQVTAFAEDTEDQE